MSKAHLDRMEASPKQWLRSIDDFRLDLDLMMARLTCIARNYAAPEVAVMFREYENQIALKQKNLDALEQNIRLIASKLNSETGEAEDIPIATTRPFRELQNKFQIEQEAVNELRTNFKYFGPLWL